MQQKDNLIKILLSIKPEYAIKILNGDKRYEFRKAIFKDQSVSKIVMYATKPLAKVVGEFEIDDILQDDPKSLWKATKKYSGITHKFFFEYFNGRKKAFAIKIKNPSKYQPYLELRSIIDHSRPPQSFYYLKNKSNRYLK